MRPEWIGTYLVAALACGDAAVSAVPCNLAIAPSESLAVTEVIVSDEPACSADALEVEHLVTLGGDKAGALSNPPHDIVSDSRGRLYLLASQGGVEAPVVYANDGRFISALGRIGEGPGEFRMPMALFVGSGDTVFVMDVSARRLTVFSPDHEVVRTVMLPHRLEMGGRVAVPLEDGRVATNMDTRSQRDSSGPVLQILNPDGSIAHQFGNDAIPIRRWVDDARSLRTLGTSRHGIWSGTVLFEYRMELWDTTGRRVRMIRRQPAWFQPYDTLISRSPDHPPDPVLLQVREDSEGRLWTVVQVAGSQWAVGLSRAPVRGEGGVQYHRTEDPERVLDTYLEILDPVSGRLLISRRFDGLFTYLINDTLIGRHVQDELGIPAVEIYRISLSQ